MEYISQQIHRISPRNIVIICIGINILSTVFVGLLIIVFGNQSSYLQFGPNENLLFLGIAIDDYYRYLALLALIAFIQLTSVIYVELASPIISFNVYDPNVKNIENFTKNELHFLTNLGFTISGVKNVLSILLSVSQVDIALWNTIVFEIFCVFTVRFLLNKKTFVPSVVNHVV